MRHWGGVELGPQGVEDVLPGQSPAVDRPVGRLEGGDVLRGVPAAPQADDVEPDDAAALAVEEHVGGHVLHHAGVATDHRQPADPAELVDRHRP